jgi:Tol biopolymer transport system component
MTVDTKQVEKIASASNGIYWVGWVPGAEQIIYLSGREDGRSMHNPMMGNKDGKFKLTAITPLGEHPREIFSQYDFDVRDVFPDLSPDGRYIAFTGQGGHVNVVFVAATDGSGVEIISTNGPNRYPFWRPIR